MAKYWNKRAEVPTEVNTNSASSDSGGEDSLTDSEDDTRHTNDNCASSVAARSSPIGVEDDDDDPATSFAKYRAKQAAKAKHSGHSGWKAELRSWNQSLSLRHTEKMDLVEYWQVRICIHSIVLLLIYPIELFSQISDYCAYGD